MMGELHIRVLQPGDEAALETFLAPRVESSMFLLGNMRAVGLVDRGERYEGTYAAAFQGGEIVSVLAHFWNGNLILQAPRYVDQLWRVAVAASERPIKGLVGPQQQVEALKTALGIEESQLDEVSRLYSLDLGALAVPEALRAGRVAGRRITAQDLDLVSAWRVAYAIETLGEQDGPDLQTSSRVDMQRSLKEGRTWVLEAEGEVVSVSSFNTAIQEAVQVGGVWTPPELRRRGYGRCVVAASLLDARAEGAQKGILFTGEENVAAQRAYEALGFRHSGDYRLLILGAPLAPAMD